MCLSCYLSNPYYRVTPALLAGRISYEPFFRLSFALLPCNAYTFYVLTLSYAFHTRYYRVTPKRNTAG